MSKLLILPIVWLMLTAVVDGESDEFQFNDGLISPEDELVRFLLKKCPFLRSNRGRPVIQAGPLGTTAIGFIHVDFLRLLELDDFEQRLSVSARVTIAWYYPDCAFWNKSELSEEAYKLEYVKFPKELIWHPQMTIVNGYSEADTVEKLSTNVIVYNGSDRVVSRSGNPYAFLQSGGKYDTLCKFDFRSWPFDRQSCFWDFVVDPDIGELLLLNLQIKFNQHDIAFGDSSFVEPSDHWALVKNGTCARSRYGVYRIWIVFDRRPQYYILSIFVPTTLLVALEFAAFILPPKIPDRSAYAVTIMLALSVMQPVVTDDIPKTAAPVYLFYYIQGNLGLVALMTVYSLFACTWSRSGNQKVYNLFRCINLSIYRAGDIAMAIFSGIIAVTLNTVFFSLLLTPDSSTVRSNFDGPDGAIIPEQCSSQK